MSEDPQNADGLFDLPYAQRQFVQFETAVATLPEEKEEENPNLSDILEERDESFFKFLLKPLAPLFLASSYLGAGLLVGGVALQKYEEAHDMGIDIIPVPTQEAAAFNLPPGHPQKDVLYVAHPSDPTTYLPAADFHRLAFEHKFAEAIRLLTHLGAKTINVHHTRGWNKEFAGTLAAGIPQAEGTGSASAGANAGSSTELLYEARLTGHDEPRLPENMVWYPHEPTWKSIAEARTEFGLERFNLKLQYTDDYGVNADLAIDVQNAGFSLGGSFEKHQKTVWSLDGVFGG